MGVACPGEFSTGNGQCLTGLGWMSVEGYAAELTRDNGDVYYRDRYVCTVWNDEDGGDMVGLNGNRMTDAGVRRKCRRIDRELEGE